MEDNFEKKVRQSMTNPPEYPFDDKLWADMDKRLEQQPSRKGVGFWVWLPYFLLLLLGTGSGYMYHLLNEHKTQLSQLETLVSTNQTHTNAETVHKTTYVFDTIYKQIIIQEYQQAERSVHTENQQLSAEWLNLGLASAQLNRGLLKSRNAFSDSSLSYLGNTPTNELSLSPFANAQSAAPLLASDLMSTEALDMLDFDIGLDYERNFGLPTLLPTPEHQQRFINQLRKAVTPNSYALSTHAGSFAALNIPLSEIQNFALGFDGVIQMSDHWDILIGGEYLINNFKQSFENGEMPDPSLFPLIPPSNVGDNLHEIYGKFQYLQIPFGIKHNFKYSGKVKPYLSAGLTASSVIKSDLIYEYINNGNEYTLINPNLLSSKLKLMNGWASVGVTYDWKERWALIAELSSQFDISNALFNYNYEEINFLKFRVGSRYQF